jgi:hypothetical protein
MLTLKRASKSRPSGEWSDDDYDVFDGDRQPRGGLSEIRSGVLIKPLRWKQRSSASCASQADPMLMKEN